MDAGFEDTDRMNPERLKQLWSDPQNYRGSVYRCEEDPRVVIPKRQPGTGWTLNFAHSRAWWVLASMPLAVLLPAVIALLIWPKTLTAAMGAFLLGGALVVTGCVLLDSKING
jgi:hypothetical protein